LLSRCGFPTTARYRDTNPRTKEAKGHGCRNILALRGDPPAGREEWEAVEGGFVHGSDLVRHIQRRYTDYFDIAVPGFPQTILLPPDELEEEMKYLKEKIDLGCSFIFTQMFYDVDVFVRWVKAVRAYGITVPIVPGIMPIQTWNGFQRATSLAKTIIPDDYRNALEPLKNDDEQVRALGTKLVADLCRKILDSGLGIKGLHFYTMNLEMGTKLLLEELGLVPRVQTLKPLPWRQVGFCWSMRFLADLNALAVPHSNTTIREHPSYILGE
jgi:methylenetetrahydrofolate reductase (NADPH)